MGRRLHTLDGEFTELFRKFKHSAFRLETLQWYGVGYEEGPLEQFLAGKPVVHDPSKDEWCGMIRNAVASGRRMERVHVVVEPLTDYLRYEMHSYAPNVEAGEDIRLIPVRDGDWPADLPKGHDFWLFDSRDLWVHGVRRRRAVPVRGAT